MLRLILNGAGGRMSRAVEAALAPDERIVGRADAHEGAKLSACAAPADALIDFSVPEALPGLLAFALSRELPLVIGTTGHADASPIARAAEQIPILYEANFSPGAHLLLRLAREAARHGRDARILEIHHRGKRDAPSGTAKRLSEALGGAPVASVRAGAAVGVHEVGFYGEMDEIILRHTALDRALFARGALDAARWLARCAPGLYALDDCPLA